MRNKFEKTVSAVLPKRFRYEAVKLDYVIESTYLPDWTDKTNKVIIEAKGRFLPADRRKMMAVKAQHPEWTIIFVFQNPNQTISKTSKTTYRKWAEKNGFLVSTIAELKDWKL